MVGLDYVINILSGSLSGIKKGKQNVKGLDKAVTKTNRNLRSIKRSSKVGIGGLISMAKKAIPIVAGIFALNSAIAFGNELTNVTAKFEGYNNAIKFGSGDEFGKNIQFLDKTIKDMSLDMDASFSGFQNLTGALKGTSLEGQGVRDIFEGISMASAVMNLKAEQTKGAFLAIGQIASKGKVQAEEIRGQLGERIPGALAIASRAMGISQVQFNKMLDDGKLYAEDFLPKFAKELKKTFQDGMPAAANSMQAAINRKNNALLSFKRVFSDALRPAITGVLETGTKLFGFLKELFSHLNPVKQALKGVWQALEPLRSAFERNIDANKKFIKGGSAAETVMNGLAQAIKFITPAISFIAEVLGFVENSFRQVRTAIMETTQSIAESNDFAIVSTQVMQNLKYIFELLKPAINAVFTIVAALVKVFGAAITIMLRMTASLIKIAKKSEFVQRTFNALKTSVTTVFQQISSAAKNYLGGVGDLLIGIFTFDVDKIKSGLRKGFEGVKTVVTLPVKQATASYKAFNAELTKGVGLTEAMETAKSGNAAIPNKSNSKFVKSGTGSGSPTKTSNISGNVSSGRSVKNITFKIESLVKELKIQPQTLQQGAQDVERIVKDIFIRLIRDVELQTN